MALKTSKVNQKQGTQRHRANKSQPPLKDVLDELLPLRQGESELGGLKLVDSDRISTRPQPRKAFDEEEMTNLKESIHESARAGLGIESTGIFLPLLVRADPNAPLGEAGYILIAGERRLRAARALKLPRVPAIVVDTNENATRMMQLVENIQRQDLTPLEESEAIAELKEQQNLSVRNLAQMLGKGKGYIEQMLDLHRSGPDIKDLVSWRQDSVSIAREIDKVKEPKLRAELIEAVRNGASMKQVRRRLEQSEEAASMPSPSSVSYLTRSASVPLDPSMGNGHTPAVSPQVSTPQTNKGATNTSPDPIVQSLRPGISFIAEAARQLEGTKLTARYRQAARAELELLKAQVQRLEKVLGQ